MIRLTIPSIEEDDLHSVNKVLASGYLVQGQHVEAFEKAVAAYVGTAYAIAVSNCTAALHLALLAIDVHPGDLVLVTSYSWLSTANVIELCGAQPVFVDIRPDTFNMDPYCLEKLVKRLMGVAATAQRVKAILPVHTFGNMADMPDILQLAESYDLPIIEDAAGALGASMHGRQAGTWGLTGCFSFHPRKAITTGEGGVITTDDSVLARRLKALRNHGLDPDASFPDFIMPGFNYRMTEFQAALGISQMSKLDGIIASRCRLSAIYNEIFKDTPLQQPRISENSKSVYQSYVLLLPEFLTPQKSRIIDNLKEKGIETSIGTWNMPMTTYFRNRYGYRTGDFPVTDRVFAQALALPLYESLSHEEQQFVVEALLNMI